jgi:hypothetical protein
MVECAGTMGNLAGAQPSSKTAEQRSRRTDFALFSGFRTRSAEKTTKQFKRAIN